MHRCHLLIKNATVVDGSGTPPFAADVAIESDRILAVVPATDQRTWHCDESIDASALCLTPGFIDAHTHDDLACLNTPDMTPKISQGVTSVIAGNCGISMAPLSPDTALPPPFPLLGNDNEFRYPTVAHYREAYAAASPSVNLALLCGHSTLRAQVMQGDLDRAATTAELQDMCGILHQAMDEGAIGLSSGLDYPPAMAAPTSEMVTLASVLKPFTNAVYTTHMRNEGDAVLDSVEESLQTGASSGVPVILSHHKCAGPSNYGKSVQTLDMIRGAASRQPVGLDVYPYTASSTSLIPRFIREAEEILITYSEPHPECAMRSLFDVAREWGCDLSEAAERLYPAGAIYFQMDEADVERILKFPATMVGSDGLPGMNNPHPRLWGTFPRIFSRYVRERGLLSLSEAVHKMTGLTAKTFGLQDRGEIRPGNFADLVLFQVDSIADRATYEHPEQCADGIHSVFVNGQLVWRDQELQTARPGRFLQH